MAGTEWAAVADWRHPLSGERSAWYPTVRVSWNDLVRRVCAELEKQVEIGRGEGKVDKFASSTQPIHDD
jgi:hypothetical protein